MSLKKDSFDVIVVGAGHAGCEAYAAACRAGVRTVLVTPSLAQAAHQPCNPAVGGPGKGHLVREVVALGGLIGQVTDQSGLQFRTLNIRKGPAVRSTRVQTDSALYIENMAAALCQIENGAIIEDRAIGLLWKSEGKNRRVLGLSLEKNEQIFSKSVVIATGTFLRGKLFVGNRVTYGGRMGAAPSVRLACSLEETGLPLIRLKTGTCPRLYRDSINFSGLLAQQGDVPQPFFDPRTKSISLPQVACYVTYTGEKAHRVIRNNLHKSALYSGAITGIGPRYCPSIETKIDRFAGKESHQIFLEPEDRFGKIVYPSGLSTSLPEDVQEEMVHAISGLEKARIARYGYAIEYDAVQPRSLGNDLSVEGFDGLYLAGQILGTSGYEEAAALGLLAGVNAALWVKGDRPVVFSRDQAYMGVMVDDLTVKGVDEPYRMFTSRAEYRLLLREDNADERLLDEALRTQLLSVERAADIKTKLDKIKQTKELLEQIHLTPTAETNSRLTDTGIKPIVKPSTLYSLLQRHEVRIHDLVQFAPSLATLPQAVKARIEVDVKYKGYLDRQLSSAMQLGNADKVVLPKDLRFEDVPGLRAEFIEKLTSARPSTLGQAGRIPGITPSALQILHLWLEKKTD